MKIVCVIPARGGSKGIRRKNLRFFDGKPLIYYVINTCLSSEILRDVVVTTEDGEILEYVSEFNVKIRERPEELSKDDVPLDPVIIDAVNWYKKNFGNIDIIVTVQPTSPLLSTTTLDKAIEEIIHSNNIDTIISGIEDTHLFWRKEKGLFLPNYEKRSNRQFLPKIYKETGGFIICKREVLQSGTRIGKNVKIFEVDPTEGIDIDSELDWYIAEALKKRPRFLFATTANAEIGMGHLYRTLTLTNYLIGYPRTLVVFNISSQGKELIEEYGYDFIELNNYWDVVNIAKEFDIIINDFLDTEDSYINTLSLDKFVVNFEDLGSGADLANIVFNDIYELSNPPKNHKYGYNYFILNENIMSKRPNEFNREVRNILITFGGVDQNNLTLKTLKVIDELKMPSISVKVILGPNYQHHKELEDFLKRINWQPIVLNKVRDMGKEMKNIDLAITSNGRTVYELAAMYIPTISIAQNNRETMHLFARYSKGIKYLGLADTVNGEELKEEISNLIFDAQQRYKMYKALKEVDLRNGVKRVLDVLFREFWRWKYERDKNRQENNFSG